MDTEKRLRLQLRLHDGRLAYAIALVKLHHPGGRLSRSECVRDGDACVTETEVFRERGSWEFTICTD